MELIETIQEGFEVLAAPDTNPLAAGTYNHNERVAQMADFRRCILWRIMRGKC